MSMLAMLACVESAVPGNEWYLYSTTDGTLFYSAGVGRYQEFALYLICLLHIGLCSSKPH